MRQRWWQPGVPQATSRACGPCATVICQTAEPDRSRYEQPARDREVDIARQPPRRTSASVWKDREDSVNSAPVLRATRSRVRREIVRRQIAYLVGERAERARGLRERLRGHGEARRPAAGRRQVGVLPQLERVRAGDRRGRVRAVRARQPCPRPCCSRAGARVSRVCGSLRAGVSDVRKSR